eukprot:TRINITY_DN5117_c0_g1_i4.p1 TRINITY_DN5117_c0_g1~~TRINITY_DN5117_c0_g1_i4.p1  ORF type:complete len:197 (+),score=35.34 TRINITY_DN5117_c0_g1_i4:56-646(+)
MTIVQDFTFMGRTGDTRKGHEGMMPSKMWAKSALESQLLSTFFGVAILINISMIFRSIVNSSVDTNIVIMGEFYINTMLFVEMFLKVVLHQKSYFLRPSSWLDMSVFGFSVFSMILIYQESEHSTKTGLLAMMIRLLRDFVRFARLGYMLYRHKERLRISPSTVDFRLLPSDNPDSALEAPKWKPTRMDETLEELL